MSITLSVCSFNDEKIAKEWKRLCSENGKMNYYASYEFNRMFMDRYGKNKKRKAMKPVLIRAANEKDEAVLFLPLCKRHDSYYMIWDYSSVPYCDAIYGKAFDRKVFDEVFRNISNIIGNEVIYFTRMDSRSCFTAFLLESYTYYKRHTCASVALIRSYTSFCGLLSKECRDNIEEAKEKVKSRGLSFRTDIFCDKQLPKKVLSDIFSIKYGAVTSVFKRMKNKKHEKKSTISRALRNGKNSVTAVAYIDDEPVSYISGFEKNGVITLAGIGSTRHGVDYSSRHLMMNDFVKFAIEQRKISSIDMCRNHDKLVLDFGASHHHVYNFEVKL